MCLRLLSVSRACTYNHAQCKNTLQHAQGSGCCWSYAGDRWAAAAASAASTTGDHRAYDTCTYADGTSGWHPLSYDDGTGCCWASGPEVGRAGDCVNFASSVPRSTVPRYTFFLGMLRAGFRGALEGTVPGALRRGAADYASAQGALVSPHNFCWSRLSVLRILGWAVRPTWAMASSSARVLESRGRKPAFAGNVAAVAAVLLRFARSKLNTLRSKRFIMYTSERDVRTMVDKIKPYVSLINESRPHSCLSLVVSTLQCKCAFVLPTLTLDGQWVCAFLPTEVGRAPA